MFINFKLIHLKRELFLILIVLCFLIFLASCSGSNGPEGGIASQFPPRPDPKSYVCYRTTSVIVPDGILNEKDWEAVPFTEYFTDIEGNLKPSPGLKTHAKLLWDDKNLYIGAEIEEPHVWATLKQRDTVIFFDNDFEVFIDPDGDTHAYYELEVNALGTPWDLLLIKPYRDGGPAVNGWNINGLQVGTHVDGTINDPSDNDKGWSVEIVLPLSALKECAGKKGSPRAGHQWRIDFSRVEWRTLIENGKYIKEVNPQTGRPFPEDNWVWSPQGRINMHMPEMWGLLQFSSVAAGEGTELFVPDPGLDKEWALRMIYYGENDYFKKHGTYSSDLNKIGLKMSDFPANLPSPELQSTQTTFECFFPAGEEESEPVIYQDGRIIDRKLLFLEK